MVDLVFRLPGAPGGLFYERLKWKILPLIAVLLRRGYSVKCVALSEQVQADVNIWIVNEITPTVRNDQKNILWFCHHMKVLSWAEMRSFDGIMTTSHAHSKFLKHLFKSERQVTYLPWPIDLDQPPDVSPDQQSTDPNADWVVMWNVQRQKHLLAGESWVIDHADRFRIFGQRWERALQKDLPNMPTGQNLPECLNGVPAYWSIDLLRNRASGFLDSFALHALARGKRVYSETLIGLPKALDHLVTMLDLQADETKTILAERPLSLTQREIDKAHHYIGHHHYPDRLADRFERTLGRLVPKSTRSGAVNIKAQPSEIHLYQDQHAFLSDQSGFSRGQTALDADAIMAQSPQCRLIFHPTAPDKMPAVTQGCSHEMHIQKAAFDRLRVAAIALRYADRLTIAPATEPNPLRAPVHDFTDLLIRVDHWTKGTGDDDLLSDLNAVMDSVLVHTDFPAGKISDLSPMWQRIANATWDPERNVRFISAQVNDYDLHVARTAELHIKTHELALLPLDRAPRCAVFAHIFYPELAPRLLGLLENIPVNFKLYIGTTDPEKAELIRHCLSAKQRDTTEIRIFENKGRDVYSKLYGFGDVYHDLDLCLHIHSKKSPHSETLSTWREQSLEALLGSVEQVQSIFALFENDPEVGLVCPSIPDEILPGMNWMRNWRIATYLNRSLKYTLPAPGQPFAFPAGSMFWTRPTLLRPLMNLRFNPDDFPQEEGQQDGTLAHAIERLVGISVVAQNKKLVFVDP